MFDTNADWIVERTGINERHVGGSTVDLSVESGRKAMDMSGVDPLAIDGLILATTTPDRVVPASAPAVQYELGLKCGAFDVNAACSGFMYALVTAHGLIAMGAKKMLCIGTDTLPESLIGQTATLQSCLRTDQVPWSWSVGQGPGQMLGWDLDSDGSSETIFVRRSGRKDPDGRQGDLPSCRAAMVDSATKSLQPRRRGTPRHHARRPAPGQHPHHSGCDGAVWISQWKRHSTVLHYTGNTSSASIPLAMVDALDAAA